MSVITAAIRARHRLPWDPWGVAAAYTVLFTVLSALRYRYWIATGWDLGFYQQSLWQISREGLGAFSSMAGYPVLADTASFVLLLLAPLYRSGGVFLLLLAQSAALGLGYPAIRYIARAMGVGTRPARLLGLIYLLYPALWGANLYDFHPDALAVPLFFGAVLAVERRRWSWLFPLLLAALAVKDTAALAVMGLGLALLLRRRTGWGLATALLGATALGFDVFYFIPHLLHQPMAQWTTNYASLGPTPAAGLANLASHPWIAFSWVAERHAWRYLGYLLGPLLVVLWGRRAWRSPYWIPAALIAEVNLLSSFTPQISPYNQFSLFIIPFAFAAALDALRSSPVTPAPATSRWLALPLLLMLVVGYREVRFQAGIIPNNIPQIQAAARLIPSRSPLVAQNYLIPHFANRPKLQDTNTLLQNTPVQALKLPRGTYVFLDTASSTGSTPYQELQQLVTRLQGLDRARLLFASRGVLLYRIS
ncbi:MAG: DUF2079 domain-containing protein [Thermaerobacter sp.]|jgi:uncharacterized membrane protein|nr:DUF2079 domain-containing protein [Thermaerobacter sp.]